MKKGVWIAIFCLALLGVLCVAFFGTYPVGIVPTTYISSVEILDANEDPIPEDEKTQIKSFQIEFSAAYQDSQGVSYMPYVFNTKILPEDSTLKAVTYYCSENAYVTIPNSKNGALLIKGMDIAQTDLPLLTIYLYCKADDGGKAGVQDQIRLTIKYGDPIIWG
jgi:hypothetical protein